MITVRAYTRDDLVTVQGWAQLRKMVIPEHLIPRDAFMVEDENGPSAFACLYFRIFCAVCSLDNFTTRPGLNGVKANACWQALEAAAFARVAEIRASGEADYRIFETFVDSRMGKHAENLGYTVGKKPHFHISKIIP